MAKGLQFAVGDIVKLKSGGPDMTVKYLPSATSLSDRYTCQWFAGKKLEQGEFPEAALVKVEPKEQ